MKKKQALSIVLVIVVAAAAVSWYAFSPRLASGQSIRYLTRPVGYADIAASVNETGTINPVNTVQVGSEVSGTIISLNADYNSLVKKGQTLATLDPRTYQSAVSSSQASLRLAQANLYSAQVNVGKTKAQLDLAKLTVQRDEPLAAQGLINQNQMDTERTQAVTAEQDYLSSQSAVNVAEAQVSVAKGNLDQAQYNLSKTVILSPFDGIVMARNVSLGQTVAASLSAPTIFTLATNLTDMQVDTSVDEADVGSVSAGAAAQITVTAFPNIAFKGSVSQVRINPTIVQNVVTYDAVIAVHDTQAKLLPGMTAQVSIEVGKRNHVLSVPIAAVLYRPLAASAAQTATSPFGGGGGGFGAGVSQSPGASSQAVAGAPGSRVTLWVLQNGRPSPVQVVIGLSDGKNIEITGGTLAEGDPVIVSQRRGAARNAPQSGVNGQNTGASPPGTSAGRTGANGAPTDATVIPASGTTSSAGGSGAAGTPARKATAKAGQENGSAAADGNSGSAAQTQRKFPRRKAPDGTSAQAAGPADGANQPSSNPGNPGQSDSPQGQTP
jgi:HlyD family secretion protein